MAAVFGQIALLRCSDVLGGVDKDGVSVVGDIIHISQGALAIGKTRGGGTGVEEVVAATQVAAVFRHPRPHLAGIGGFGQVLRTVHGSRGIGPHHAVVELHGGIAALHVKAVAHILQEVAVVEVDGHSTARAALALHPYGSGRGRGGGGVVVDDAVFHVQADLHLGARTLHEDGRPLVGGAVRKDAVAHLVVRHGAIISHCVLYDNGPAIFQCGNEIDGRGCVHTVVQLFVGQGAGIRKAETVDDGIAGIIET